jgi:hypothetical protein
MHEVMHIIETPNYRGLKINFLKASHATEEGINGKIRAIVYFTFSFHWVSSRITYIMCG